MVNGSHGGNNVPGTGMEHPHVNSVGCIEGELSPTSSVQPTTIGMPDQYSGELSPVLVNPYADVARTVVESVRARIQQPRHVRVGFLLRSGFGEEMLSVGDKHTYFDALAETPGVQYLGNADYLIKPFGGDSSVVLPDHVGSPEYSGIERSMELLADEIINQTDPGKDFSADIVVNTGRLILGDLSKTEVENLVAAVTADPRIMATKKDGIYRVRGVQHVKPTPRSELASQPAVPSEVVVTSTSLNHMIRTALRGGDGAKPHRGRKHNGWKRAANMDGYEY